MLWFSDYGTMNVWTQTIMICNVFERRDEATADALVTSRILCASSGVLQFAAHLSNISSILKTRFLVSFGSEADDISLTISSTHSILLAGVFITGTSDATAINNRSRVRQDANCTNGAVYKKYTSLDITITIRQQEKEAVRVIFQSCQPYLQMRRHQHWSLLNPMPNNPWSFWWQHPRHFPTLWDSPAEARNSPKLPIRHVQRKTVQIGVLRSTVVA